MAWSSYSNYNTDFDHRQNCARLTLLCCIYVCSLIAYQSLAWLLAPLVSQPCLAWYACVEPCYLLPLRLVCICGITRIIATRVRQCSTQCSSAWNSMWHWLHHILLMMMHLRYRFRTVTVVTELPHQLVLWFMYAAYACKLIIAFLPDLMHRYQIPHQTMLAAKVTCKVWSNDDQDQT